MRTDGGKHQGIGHIRRSQTLAAALRDAGFGVRIVACSSEARQFVPETADFSGAYDLLIFDVPYDFAASLEPPLTKIVALDYSGSFQPTLTVSVFEPRRPAPPGLRFAGLEYAIVRPDVVAIRRRLSQPRIPGGAPNAQQRVLVLPGGADVGLRGPGLARSLALQGYTVDLIQGPAVEEAYPDMGAAVRVHHNPPDLADLMVSCDWAVSNGGSSMLELMALGKPVFVVPQTHLEAALAKEIHERGGLLGWGDTVPESPDEDALNRTAEKAWFLVDGFGPERIINLMERFAI